MSGGTIVILARPNDPAAAMMAERWSSEDACIVTPWDLSTPGWSYRSSEPHLSMAVAGGRKLPASEIGSVVTRMPCVFQEDLGYMEPEDRAYAASEMTAFLLAWLTGLKCPVINRPTPTLLWGPSWRQERWVQVADDLGIPVAVARRRTPSSNRRAKSPMKDTVTVTVVGQRCLGDVDKALARQARQLADAAGVELLTARFSGAEKGARFLGASIWPDTVTGDMADALLELMR